MVTRDVGRLVWLLSSCPNLRATPRRSFVTSVSSLVVPPGEAAYVPRSVPHSFGLSLGTLRGLPAFTLSRPRPSGSPTAHADRNEWREA